MRDRITDALKDAMRAKDAVRLSTLRLMSACVKDHDIAKRGSGDETELSEAEIVALLAKMVKQRDDSAVAYEEAGRVELAERERAEQAVIREFLPKPMSDDEIGNAVTKAISETGASTIRDMGKVMAALKSAYAGRMDFGKVSGQVKSALG